MVLDGEDKDKLTAAMREIGADNDSPFFIRDVGNVDACHCIVLIGASVKPRGLNCALCGVENCAAAVKDNISCALAVNNLGIAVGSAAATAMDHRIDNRVLFTAGMAALRLNLFPDKAKMDIDIYAVIKSLCEKRKVFHSEADFQFALAWELQEQYKTADIRLEYPVTADKGRHYIDILMRHDGNDYPIEVKYLKKPLRHSVGKEQFILAEGVHDMEMYDCIADIARLESFRKHLNGFSTGYDVWLTNDHYYWDSNYDASYYKELHAPEGLVKTGRMHYIGEPKILKQKGYQSPIALSGSYTVNWNDYSDLNDGGAIMRNGLFRCALISVSK